MFILQVPLNTRTKGNKIENPKNEVVKCSLQEKQKQNDKCSFYNMVRDIKKNDTKYYVQCANKCTFINLVCSTINLASIPRNTQLLDSRVTTNITV